MGYRTYHTLEVLDKDGKLLGEDIQKKHRDELVEENIAYWEDEIKWYDHRQDMCEYSKRYPELVFKLHGEGEETEDLWDEYYHDGRYQEAVAVITYPSYDPNKLEEL